MYNIFFILLAIIFPPDYDEGQDVVRLDNPSFEGTPQDASTPVGWVACGENSTPDILPGYWGVYNEPSDGTTYLGLITREDGTWESIGQHLRKPLKANECYSFSIDLARASSYAGYDIPVKLQMWGATKKCSRQQLLAETSVVRHTNWKTYNFEFTPKKNFDYIVLEARNANGIYFAYNGNLLLDHCTPIKRCIRAMN
jgi:hypothetical protein